MSHHVYHHLTISLKEISMLSRKSFYLQGKYPSKIAHLGKTNAPTLFQLWKKMNTQHFDRVTTSQFAINVSYANEHTQVTWPNKDNCLTLENEFLKNEILFFKFCSKKVYAPPNFIEIEKKNSSPPNFFLENKSLHPLSIWWKRRKLYAEL